MTDDVVKCPICKVDHPVISRTPYANGEDVFITCPKAIKGRLLSFDPEYYQEYE